MNKLFRIVKSFGNYNYYRYANTGNTTGFLKWHRCVPFAATRISSKLCFPLKILIGCWQGYQVPFNLWVWRHAGKLSPGNIFYNVIKRLNSKKINSETAFQRQFNILWLLYILLHTVPWDNLIFQINSISVVPSKGKKLQSRITRWPLNEGKGWGFFEGCVCVQVH